MLCTHRTTQKQSHQIETCRAWLEYTIEFDTPPQPCEYTFNAFSTGTCHFNLTYTQPCEYTFKFSTGIGLYLLVAINSLSRSLHLLRLINGKNISSSFALGHITQCVNMSAKFCVLAHIPHIFFNHPTISLKSIALSITPPRMQSSLEATRFCEVCFMRHSHVCVSSSISHLPQQSSLEATRFSNLCASCVQHLVCERMHVLHCCPL